MQFIPMAGLLQRARAGGYAVPAFCTWNAETIETVLSVAQDLKAPVVVMNGPIEFTLLRPADMGAVAHAIARRFNVPAALHLDHGDSLSQVEACLAAGYTSVMLDYSSRPFAENAEAMRQVVALVRPRGITVEGEIGHVGTVGDLTLEGAGTPNLTEPEEATAFVAQTGIDAVAVAIGNAHGQYVRLPQLDFERLAALHAAVPVPLVLHGGSGTPEQDLRRAISLGIAKVNVATELIGAVRDSLVEQWQSGENLWTPAADAVAMQALAPVVEKWIRLTGAAGQAWK